jgi:putative FmdB family regulatory protein
MPIYEFICLSCGNDFERLQSFSDTSTPSCPQCQSSQVQRRLSPPAIHFKGSGWYVTDSKNGVKNGKATQESGEKSSEAGGEKNNASGEGKASDAKSAEAPASEAKPAGGKQQETTSPAVKASA